MEPDQIDVLALAVLRDVEEVDHALETRLPRQLRRDVREIHRQDRIHLDLPLLHAVTVSDLDVRTHPYPDAARDLPSANTVTQALGEDQPWTLPVSA